MTADICAAQGHVQTGVATGTDPASVLWGSFCHRCGAYLLTPALMTVHVKEAATFGDGPIPEQDSDG